MPRRKHGDLIGERVGRLVILEDIGKGPSRKVRVRCDCGVEKLVAYTQIISGRTNSCGCLREELRIKHGHNTRSGGQTSTYTTWHSMLQRCTNKNSPEYYNYGGRGIIVCEGWMRFENFLKDMGEKPKGTHIDRINNELGYYKENCRWVTPLENMQNKRTSVYVEALGKKLTLKGWERETGINHETLRYRILHGVSPDIAVIPNDLRSKNI